MVKLRVFTTNRTLERELREYKIPIITRVYKGAVYIDLRTILEDDYEVIFNALKGIGEK